MDKPIPEPDDLTAVCLAAKAENAATIAALRAEVERKDKALRQIIGRELAPDGYVYAVDAEARISGWNACGRVVAGIARAVLGAERTKTAAQQQTGCVCPSGSEATCQGMMCPRNPIGPAIARAALGDAS